MNTIKINKSKTQMIAHRGVSKLEKENTIPAFIAAGNRSYYGIECDIHKTLDGKYIVCHDENLKRVSNVDIIIEENNFEELRKIKLLNLDGTKTESYYYIPTLEEYLEICIKYEKQAILEIKGNFPKEDVMEVIEIIKKYNYLDNLTFICFYPQPLVYVREALPNQDIQFLTGEMKEEIYDFCFKYNFGIDAHYNSITPELITKFHEHNLKVNVWTVDDVKASLKLIELGIDFITTNILE